ncbi:MAG: cob(I)yrinic acid a,c-diamide adenosyltransferase [Bacteroidaceae bacterium]|nr:cob(I)yrinic acid a,c-diamide adenosyltransferase [Bacteroidaceae bacterium]
MKKSHLYTRTGDDGTTSLVGGQRVPKTHARLEAYGTVDELNSHLGLLLSCVQDSGEENNLLVIQNQLFVICSELATADEDLRARRSSVTEEDVAWMERAIDAAEDGLPGWRGFILPGGTTAAAQAHVCRTVCRRAERRIHALAAEAEVNPLLLAYVNRLSDYLFALAQKLNHQAGKEEQYWRKSEKKT